MKIGLETTVLINKNRTGVDYYTYHLYREAIRQMHNDEFYLCYVAFMTKPNISLEIEAANTITKVLKFIPGRIYYSLLKKGLSFPIDWLLGIRPDVFVFPNFIRWPLVQTKKSVVVVYDLSFIKARQHAVSEHAKFLTKQVPKSVSKSDHVIVISKNTKRELMQEYNTPESKISIIYPAVNHELFKPADKKGRESVRQKYKLPGKYILSLGTQEPRKNLVGLLLAYEKLPQSFRDEYPLVMSGGKGWLDDELNKIFARVSKESKIIRTGYVDEDDLPGLYSGATVFVFPSFYEGFGMPPLEAMACGVPVIVSDNSSLPEVVEKAGVYVNANDKDTITDALKKVLASSSLRKEMSRKGILQAKKFRWENAGKQMKELLEKL